MKLITKFILIYLFVSTLMLGLGGVISYYVIRGEIEKELKWEFLERIDRVTYLLEKGKRFKAKKAAGGDRNLVIEKLDYMAESRVEVSDTLIWDDRLEQEELNVRVSAYRTINDSSYFISTHGNMIESDDIMEAVFKILLWMLGLQVVGAAGIGFFVSGPLFRPFRSTLERIRNFKLNEKEYLPAEETNIEEFADLNHFVEEMTRKAVSDYKNLKEFAENASHEIQTPLAIARGNLELLSETELDEEQYKHVVKLEKTIKKLSRLSESLALLTKIENHEFDNGREVNFSNLIKEGIEAFREFITLNKLAVETNIQENVMVKMHPVLADILWTNLFQNAIRHNTENGKIRVELTDHKLAISNTGDDLDTAPEELFRRFRKGSQSSETIGLGLAIIKRIADQNNLEVTYTNKNSWHHIEIILTQIIHKKV